MSNPTDVSDLGTSSSAVTGDPSVPQAYQADLKQAAQRLLRTLLRRPHIEIEALGVCVIAASFVIMCVRLGVKPFWVDESIAVLPAKSILTTGVPKSPFDLDYMSFQLQGGLWDPSAPLYRYSAAAVAALFGFSEATTRGWSVFLGLLLLIPCFAIFKRLYGVVAAWLAVTFLATLPAFANEAREARHFTFVALMMFSTFYFVLRARDQSMPVARALWPVFLTCTVLGHYIGYLVLPVLFTFVAITFPAPLLSKRYVAVYACLAVIYGGIQAKFWHTLPMFHAINCQNRTPCEPNPLYYLREMLLYFTSRDALHAAVAQLGGLRFWATLLSLFPVAFIVMGMIETIKDARNDLAKRPEHLLILTWFFVPLLLLSAKDLKFPRYIFYILPPIMLFLARGTIQASKWRAFRFSPRLAAVLLTALIVVGPQVAYAGRDQQLSVRARFVDQARKVISGDPTDDWELLQDQVRYLKAEMKPGDVVVTSFDDAGLGYYLGSFVYGFLNSTHNDEFFMYLLNQATQRGSKVFFMDTTSTHNYCHLPTYALQNIDCRRKYVQFYAACTPSSPTHNPSCVRREIR